MNETKADKKPQLDSCPCCEGAADFCSNERGEVWVQCGSCHLQSMAYADTVADPLQKLANRWNTRSQPQKASVLLGGIADDGYASALEGLRAAHRSALRLRQPIPEWLREFAHTMAPALGITSDEVFKDIEDSSNRIDTLSQQTRALIDDIKAAAPEEVRLMVARLLRLDRALTGERVHAALGRVTHEGNFAPLLADVRKLHTQVEVRMDGYRATLERTLRALAEDLKREAGL